MLTKLTNKNQITIPKKIIKHFKHNQRFEITEQKGIITLCPIAFPELEPIRKKIAKLGIKPADVEAAIKWARKQNTI